MSAASISSQIRAARDGDRSVLDRLLESYRNYLRLLARTSLRPDLQAKVDESDLAQEALIKANARFDQFRGATDRELAGWLRKILARSLADAGRRFRGAAAREVFREQPLHGGLDASSQHWAKLVAANISSPSARAEKRELGVILADALGQLSADHREVIVMRNLEGRNWNDIAERMERKYDAVRMLWTRALEALRPRIEERI